MQIFEELVSKLKKHEVENFRGWLHQVAKNHCLMRLRSEKGQTAVNLDPALMQSEESLHLNGALESYARLIKKGRFLDEVIYDLRDASYRFPVDVNIWQSLGDAYMRANRLQDALDAYTKAEELLR